MRLKPLERAQLANALFNSISQRRLREIEIAWENEISQRLTLHQTGKMPTAPAEEVSNRLRRTFGWQK